MTGHQINSLVGDLVAMAQAMERLPQVEAALAEWQDMASKRTDEIMRLNEDLKQSKDYAASLEAKVHAAEASRDDAELRFLEADEGLVKFANAFQVALEAMNHTDKVLAKVHDYLHPMPIQPEPIVSEVKPIAVDPIEAGSLNSTSSTSDVISNNESLNEPQGQSEADPIQPLNADLPLEDHSQTSASENVIHTESAASSWASPTPPKPQPYAGKRYMDVPGFITRFDWFNGGGTEEDYHWRPDAIGSNL